MIVVKRKTSHRKLIVLTLSGWITSLASDATSC